MIQTILAALRWLNFVIWGGLLIYMLLRGGLSALGKEPRRGDPMRLGTALIALVFALGCLRLLLAPERDDLWAGVHLLSAAVGIYVICLARAYGRGPPL